MNDDAHQDWKWQVVDQIDRFLEQIAPEWNEVSEFLLEDEGQVNLAWEAIKPFFPTNRFKPGEKLTAIELGRFFGHWRCLWIAFTISKTLHDRYEQSHRVAVEARDKIDTIMLENYPDAIDGIKTSVDHLLAVTTDPAFIDTIRNNDKKFEDMAKAIREFAGMQPEKERYAFMQGYSQALRAEVLDEKGLPLISDNLAALLAFCRPFAIRAKLAAKDFQEQIDKLAGSRITGHPESFAKRLQRRNASLRGKGRPSKKRPI